eukprot:scaffold195918_cov26-Tisochrysis_lutea.AAC.1
MACQGSRRARSRFASLGSAPTTSTRSERELSLVAAAWSVSVSADDSADTSSKPSYSRDALASTQS